MRHSTQLSDLKKATLAALLLLRMMYRHLLFLHMPLLLHHWAQMLMETPEFQSTQFKNKGKCPQALCLNHVNLPQMSGRSKL